MAHSHRSISSIFSNAHLAKLHSYLRGSWEQSRACYEHPRVFSHNGGPVVMLVPGLFCTPSVMNRLGDELERLGAEVHLPSAPFPIAHGVLANTCHLERAARALVKDLVALRYRKGVESVTVVGHSNGGLIALLASEVADEMVNELPVIQGVITMACPFQGAPMARLLGPLIPACRDIKPGSDVLTRILRQGWRVKLALVSGFDFLVPEQSQAPADAEAMRMEDFQHMDFIVGAPGKIKQTADRIANVLKATGAASMKAEA